jgi:hypothetical protein
MKKNVGGIDRILRLVFGVVIGAAGIYFKSWWGLIGVLLFLTGLVRFCPLYVPFKISSSRSKSQ